MASSKSEMYDRDTKGQMHNMEHSTKALVYNRRQSILRHAFLNLISLLMLIGIVTRMRIGLAGWLLGVTSTTPTTLSTPLSPFGLVSSTLTWVPCGGTQFQCANLSVPLNYMNTSDPRRASIAITRYLVRDRSAVNGTIIFNPGGPGGSGTGATFRKGPDIEDIFESKYDVVGFDPRGINMTLPRVTCSTAPSRNQHDVGIWDSFAQLITEECEENSGVDVLPFVNTPTVARDIVAIVDTLHAEKRYHNDIVEGYFAICEKVGVARCPLAGYEQGVKKTVMDLFDNLYDRPLPVSGNDITGLVTFFDYKSFFYGTLYRPKDWRRFVDITMDLLNGNGSSFLAATAPGPAGFGTAESGTAVLCTDAMPATNYSLTSWSEFVRNMTSLSFIAGDTRSLGTIPCRHWYAEPNERWMGTFDDVHLDVPVLMIGNTNDPATPLKSAKRLQDRMGRNAVLLEQRSYGHCSGSAVSTCTYGVILDYLLDGKLPEKGKVCEVDDADYGDYFADPEKVVGLGLGSAIGAFGSVVDEVRGNVF
ncbi:hypothetical protein BP5796_01139 [Coleophoma crateriformis]|uniref:Peptidase S33 tripeptidyl aminopeptidase-like C-terminal domain-containing protein n=1 Tax=Coleophoma crateriformis TaxID=565419 RepID=A0A3D8SZK4_9HELO|nr:hypothetical protein BP5796_01139 [Coleophoma crateriformis]